MTNLDQFIDTAEDDPFQIYAFFKEGSIDYVETNVGSGVLIIQVKGESFEHDESIRLAIDTETARLVAHSIDCNTTYTQLKNLLTSLNISWLD